MSGQQPRTAKEALLAEMLGDMDALLTRCEHSKNALEALQTSIQRDHETKAGQASRDLEAATLKFGVVTTRSIDDFVGVANEALGRFMARTNEIKTSLDALGSVTKLVLPLGQSAMPEQWPTVMVLACVLSCVLGAAVGFAVCFVLVK